MYPHRIRLRGPWEMTAGDRPARRIAFPATWADAGLDGFVGPVVFERRFGYPGRIDAHERVWLVGIGVHGPMSIALQDEPLGVVHDRFAIEVTARLRERNRLNVTFDADSSRTALWDDIALEVRATAFLDGVSFAASAVRGSVAGTCDGPLEVYALAEGQTCGYRQLRAGEAFVLECDSGAVPTRIELVHISTVWDVVELGETR